MVATKRVNNVKKETGAEKRKRIESMKLARSTAHRYIIPCVLAIFLILVIALYWRYGRGGALPNDPRAILRRAMREAAKNMRSGGVGEGVAEAVSEATAQAAAAEAMAEEPDVMIET